MKNIHKNLPNQTFKLPLGNGIETANICSKTGLLANSNCESYYEYYLTGTAPTTKCTGHSGTLKNTSTNNENSENNTSFEQ